MNKLINNFKQFLIKITPRIFFVRYQYKLFLNKNLNLKNPQTLTEKIQWKKVYDKNPIYTLCTDKYAVRNYIANKIGKDYLIPLRLDTLHITKEVLSNLKPPFIIKSNHGSGKVIIIKNKNEIDQKIIDECNNWLKNNFYFVSKEWQYKKIKPRILVEKLLVDEKGSIPDDYKFHCFNGKVEFIGVHTDRFGDHKLTFFNKNWKILPFTWCGEKNRKPLYKINNKIPKPKNLNEMIYVAEKLSKDFDYVRVDLYSLNKKVFFGELTFTPGSGFGKFFPEKYDKIFGKKLKLKT